MRTEHFDYHLPASAIAQPPPRRDRSRLLVLDRVRGRMHHRAIRDLPSLVTKGDLLVVNDTKVFRARLYGTVDGKPIELLLVRPLNRKENGSGFLPLPLGGGARGGGSIGQQSNAWLSLARPARRLRDGADVRIGRMRAVVIGHESDGSVRLAFDRTAAQVIAYANRVGAIPAPPYVATSVRRLADYQTSYARAVGSVAAPTAGFHLTPQLLRALRDRGVRIARITLHVGLGTFQPIRTERIEDHAMHAEWAEVPAATARAIAATKRHGQRVIAVGTTTLRTLEGVAAARPSCHPEERRDEGSHDVTHSDTPPTPHAYSGWINLFIAPGFRFRVVDALLTNFHLPKSSLLVLVSAFAAPGERSLRGRNLILRAYRSALRHGYRFYSFGDAMLIQ